PDADTVREVCLCIPGAGRTGMFFTSEPGSREAADELGSLIDHVCRSLEGIILAQCLLAEHETRALQAFKRGGFTSIGQLSYLRRPMPRRAADVPGDTALPDGVTCDTWRSGDDGDLMEALQRSYEGTLDCPELCGLRPIEDVLESHRATGEFDGRTWWILRERGRPVGAMLFNAMKTQGAMELVYMGTAPEIRGRGIGSRLLARGLKAIAGRAEASVTCAVDHRNEPARRLYARYGFVPTAERTACIRALPGA
ncbi:MAG: GNAT family N-acetyltransferase, partial [Phycisphaerales bacterium]|nr:GNAT family N-acetyltransferase [Phycisphaerales bacterium]